MLTARRVQWLAFFGVLAAVMPFIAWFALRFWSLFAYAQEQHAMRDLVEQLPNRRPPGVSVAAWDVATGWAITACGNVCFSEGYVPIDELRRFRVDVEKRLKAEVDLTTIDWIWQRLGETGPHGQQYRKRFEPEYREGLKSIMVR